MRQTVNRGERSTGAPILATIGKEEEEESAPPGNLQSAALQFAYRVDQRIRPADLSCAPRLCHVVSMLR